MIWHRQDLANVNQANESLPVTCAAASGRRDLAVVGLGHGVGVGVELVDRGVQLLGCAGERVAGVAEPVRAADLFA
jgi:hypothetical protein